MKLYPRKLNSVEELKREQLRLKFEKLHTKASDLMPIKELSRGSKSAGTSNKLLNTALGLMNSKSSMQQAMLLAGPVLSLLRGKKKSRKYRHSDDDNDRHPKKKGFLKKAVTEIVVGYLIGKAVQVGVHAVRLLIRKRKHKKQRERIEEYERNVGW